MRPRLAAILLLATAAFAASAKANDPADRVTPDATTTDAWEFLRRHGVNASDAGQRLEKLVVDLERIIGGVHELELNARRVKEQLDG